MTRAARAVIGMHRRRVRRVVRVYGSNYLRGTLGWFAQHAELRKKYPGHRIVYMDAPDSVT